jgi:hypothetical protein
MQIQLLSEVTAANGVPTAATDGSELWGSFERGKPQNEAVLAIHSTAGSGTMTATLKLWGYLKSTGVWYPMGTEATAANKGLINAGSAVPEGPIADAIRHSELVIGFVHFDRIYLEVTAIGGTATAISAWLIGRTYNG